MSAHKYGAPCPTDCDCICHERTGGGTHDHVGQPCPGKLRRGSPTVRQLVERATVAAPITVSHDGLHASAVVVVSVEWRGRIERYSWAEWRALVAIALAEGRAG